VELFSSIGSYRTEIPSRLLKTFLFDRDFETTAPADSWILVRYRYIGQKCPYLLTYDIGYSGCW